jgi:hypothetical protein
MLSSVFAQPIEMPGIASFNQHARHDPLPNIRHRRQTFTAKVFRPF